MVGRALGWLVRLVMVATLMLTMVAGVARAGNEQPFGTLLVPGSAWLQGAGVASKGGVDVYANGDSSLVSYSYAAAAVGMRWQCVELAQRLYQQKGWASGRWGVDAWEIYGLRAFGFVSHPNNGSYEPVPGDMIVHARTAQWPAGHVSIVDSVEGGRVNVVEQNVGGESGRGSYSYVDGVLSRPGLTPILGIVHSPANPNTNAPIDHLPIGSFDLVETVRGGIRVAGWALDPDGGSAPIWVHVYVDGVFQEAIEANGNRWDVGAVYPADGPNHGFDAVVPYPTGGLHTVTLYALDFGGIDNNPSLGSREVAVNYDYTQQGSVQGDFTGDGKADVAVFYDYSGQTKLWLFPGDGFGGLGAPRVAWDSGPGNWDWSHTKPFVGDFNGDGVSDIGVLYNYGNERSKLFIFLSKGPGSNGFGFEAPYVAWDSGVGNWDWNRSMMVAGDFNGDGKTDIAALYNYGGRSKLWVFQGNGEGGLTAPAAPAWDSGAGNWEWERTKLVAADFNGDGKTDIAALYNYGNGRSKIYTFLSAGATFEAPRMAWDSGVGNWEWNRSDLLAGDFTGDGKADLASLYDYSGETKLWLFPGQGNGGFASPVAVWDSGPGNWEWWRSLPYTGDFNGDGITDIGAFYNYGNGLTNQFLFLSAGFGFMPSLVWSSGVGNWDWGRILVG